MAKPQHVATLKEGSVAWNQWREEHPDVIPDLSLAELDRLDLSKVNLGRAYLRGAQLDRAILRGAILWKADLAQARLRAADLHDANLRKANLFEANLFCANLEGANLTGALLVDTKLRRANLRGCFVYGCSVWNVKLNGAIQTGLALDDVHCSSNEWRRDAVEQSLLTVDRLEVAQFISLLLANQKMRDVIDAATSKVVLILGRFNTERKTVLDAIRQYLYEQNRYVPILFDFERARSLDLTETITLLARMARFIIADLTDPGSIAHELHAIVPDVAVPVQPIIEHGHPYAMSRDFAKYDWYLPLHEYKGVDGLLASLEEKIIAPAEAMRKVLIKKKNAAAH